MSSRRSARQLVVAILLGVMVGGGLMAITPAGAEVSQSLATSWKKIWKKELKPLADKRYYTKKKSDSTYATKAQAAAAGAAANAATDAKLGDYYKKAEADARYAPYPKTLRGTYLVSGTPGAGGYAFSTLAFGATLPAAPTVVYMPLGGPANPNCTGTPAAPAAAAGYLCIYEGVSSNANGFTFANAAGSTGSASPFGVQLRITGIAAGLAANLGGWALTPANGVAPRVAPGAGGAGAFLGH